MSFLPLPDMTQLTVIRNDYFLGYRKVGTIDGKILRKTVKGGHQMFKRRPGIGWNLELMAIADRANVEVLRVELTTGARYSVAWWIAKRFAEAAIAGDKRYLLRYDQDDQVLIPWDAWKGLITGPPEKKEKVTQPKTQGTLL